MKKRADGRYCKQIIIGYQSDGKRKTKTLYGKTIREVEAKERELRQELERGIYVENKNISVSEWADEWLSVYKDSVSNNTYRRSEQIVKNQIKPLLGDFKLTLLRLNTVQKTLNSLAATHSLSTIKKVKITLNMMYNYAIRSQCAYINPCIGLTIPKGKQKIVNAIPTHYIPYLNEFCKTYKHGAFIMTLLYTGIRRGEIAALLNRDINVFDNCIYINKAMEFMNNRARVKEPKTKSGVRAIPILTALKPYLKTGQNPNDYVFKNELGNHHTETSLKRLMESFNKEFNEFMKENCVDYQEEHITMHQFRHTYATILYEAGVDVKTAQCYLGHSTVTTTMDIYTHLSSRHKTLNADKLNAYVSQSKVSQMTFCG